LKQIKGRHFF